MTEFPSVEADELVTKQVLRAELADFRTDMARELHRHTLWFAGAIGVATAVEIAASGLLFR